MKKTDAAKMGEQLEAKLKAPETTKLAGFAWAKFKKDEWRADVGDTLPSRIKQLDAKTFCVYRAGRYLGCEASLKDAAERAKVNVRSEINREREWQQNHPDEQPLGLRLTPEERDKGWQDSPPKVARAAAKPAPPVAGGSRMPSGAPMSKHGDVLPKAKPARASKADAGSKDAEIKALLKRGCTAEELARVTGWKAVSVPPLARKLGIELRIEKGVKPFKYYGTEK